MNKWKGMRISRRLIYSLIIPLLAFALIFAIANDELIADDSRYFNMDLVFVEAEILDDGSMQVTENLKIDFTAPSGNPWNGFFITIPQDQETQIVDVVVKENGVAYEYNPGTDYGPPGTYLTIDKGDNILIDWSIQAYNESRVFQVSYRVLNAVTAHQDVVEMYRKFIGEANENRIKGVTIVLELPAGIPKEEVRMWGHGPLNGDVSYAEAGSVEKIGQVGTYYSDAVVWKIEDLPSRTFVEGRVTFPVQFLPNATKTSDKVALPEILKEEEKWAGAANRQRIWMGIVFYLPIPVLLGFIGLAIYFRRKYAPLETQFQGDYYRELPADYSPAEMSVLMRHDHPGTEDLMATIMDLARRKILFIQEERQMKKRLFGEKEVVTYRIVLQNRDENMAEHEKMLYDFLNRVGSNDANGNKSVTLNEIEDIAKSKSTYYIFNNFWSGFQSNVWYKMQSKKYFDDEADSGKFFGVGIGIASSIIAFIVLIILLSNDNFSYTFLMLSFIAGGIILAIVTGFIKRRSQKGQEDYVRWEAFKRFLLHFSEMQRQEIPALVIWEFYLVYAISLGVAKEVMKQLQIVFPNMEENGYRFGYGWYSLNRPMNFDSFNDSFNNMERAFSQSIKEAKKTHDAVTNKSSGSGGGGGFSGGGGGGGGGSSYGGR